MSKTRFLANGSSRLRLALVIVLTGLVATAARSIDRPPEGDDLQFVDALSWGATKVELDDVRRLGRGGWLKSQLRPQDDADLTPAFAAQFGPSSSKQTLREQVARLGVMAREAALLTNVDMKNAAMATILKIRREEGDRAVDSFLTRSVYSRGQLRERLTWFWLNHFNVYRLKGLDLFIGDYVDQVIRPNSIGRFADLMKAVATHPAMLNYLDNALSVKEKPNENFARELLELHSLGVDGGYVQKDVEELARVLTGFGIDTHATDQPQSQFGNGLSVFNPAKHDFGDKLFLGQRIAGRGLPELDEAITILCQHPTVARFISRKIAAYFLAQDPPSELVATMATAFTETDGDIAVVVTVMALSPEFQGRLSLRFKDPMNFVLSAVRLAYGDVEIDDASLIQQWLLLLNQGLFNRSSPDGYSLLKVDWSSNHQMLTRFRIAQAISAGSGKRMFRREPPGAPTLGSDSFVTGEVVPRLSGPTRAALASARSPAEWTMLFLSSPEFMR